MAIYLFGSKLDDFQPSNAKVYADKLKNLIECKTVSAKNSFDLSEFDKFNEVIHKQYPHLFAVCEEIPLGNSTFIRIPGKSADSPLVLMSHKDVVEANEKGWKAPPFAGEIKRGKMYGRGTFDTKASLSAIFEAADTLIAEGRTFERDFYILATATEEIAGSDATEAVNYFRSESIIPGLVFDEGGAVLINPFPSGVPLFGMVGAVERSGGSRIYSFPDKMTLQKFSKAMKKSRPGVYYIIPEVQELLEGLRDNLSVTLKPLLSFLCEQQSLTAFILGLCGDDARSFTGAGVATRKPDVNEVNSLPEEHRGDCYLLRVGFSGNYYNKIVDIARELEQKASGFNCKKIFETITETPEPVSTSSDGFRFTKAISKLVFDKIAVLPYPVLGRTDARYFVGYADDVIRYLPIKINLAQMMKFHNKNENIYISSLPQAVEFYRELILRYPEK